MRERERVTALLRKNIIKKAFTLAEVLIVMSVLGVIAAASMAVFKPHQYHKKALLTDCGKAYADISGVTDTVLSGCTKKLDLGRIYNNCDKTADTHAFGADGGQKEAEIYSRYLKGTVASGPSTENGSCPAEENFTSLRLRNHTCIYFGENKILVDINGAKGPNDSSDKMKLIIGDDGISTDLAEALESKYDFTPLTDCSQFGNCPACSVDGGCTCSEGYLYTDESGCVKISMPSNCKVCNNLESRCEECKSGYRLDDSGNCVSCLDNDCLECDSSGRCTKCSRGIPYANGYCRVCPQIPLIDPETGNPISGTWCEEYDNDCKCVTCGKPTSGGGNVTSVYDPSSNRCIFLNYCKEASDDLKCKTCISGWGLTDGTGYCKECYDKYKCKKCNESGCIECTSGYRLDSSGKCVDDCGFACNNCGESGCMGCSIGYRLDSSGKCVSCSSKCKECNEKSCIKCLPSWNLNNGKCSRD